jgi:hypothetical protein
MKLHKRFTWPLVGLAFLAGVTAAGARLYAAGYRQIATIAIPGNLAGGFDISWADAVAGRYYLADRGAVSVDVIDTKHLRYLYAIPVRLEFVVRQRPGASRGPCSGKPSVHC